VIVVDTSVWIDVLNDTPAPQAARCVELIEAGQPVALTDVILTEILQGLRSDREATRVERHLRAFPILRLAEFDDFVLAAKLYRAARRAGVTIRKTLDYLIAAPCVRTGVPLLHADADFDRLATCTPLRIWTRWKPITDAALIDEALKALLARHRSAELDARYAAYDEHPAEEPDEWGDLATWRRAAGASWVDCRLAESFGGVSWPKSAGAQSLSYPATRRSLGCNGSW
jgi:predicted nucleic acid-binding protein